MAMTPGSTAPHHVTPSLCRRTAPMFTLTTSIAVRKAIRDFDAYIHQAASLLANKCYELPKKAIRTGITTIDLTLSTRELSIFYPQDSYRRRQRMKAYLYDYACPIFSMLIALMCGALWYIHNHEPPEDESWFNFLLTIFIDVTETQFSWFIIVYVVGVLSCSRSFCSQYLIISMVSWTIFTYYINPDPEMRFYKMIPMITEIITKYRISFHNDYLRLQQSVCRIKLMRKICPKPPTPSEELLAFINDMWKNIQPYLHQKEFWQSIFVTIVVYRVLQWFLQRRAVWSVRLRVESQALAAATTQTTRALQETTTDRVAATPIISHVENHVRTAHGNMPVEAREKYLAICRLVAAGWADNRVTIVDVTEGVENEPEDLDPLIVNTESLGNVGAEKRILLTRVNTAPPNLLRKTVRIVKRTIAQLFNDIQYGQKRTLPGMDGIVEQYCGVITGPELMDISAGFTGGCEDEIAGVSRHLRQLKSLVDGEYIESTISTAAEERLDQACDVIARILRLAAIDHANSILEWSLPKKWGKQRPIWYQRLVEVGRDVIDPILTGFVKTCELALPVNKLPRLVGSMGMLACAKDAATMCSVEVLYKKFFPHLTTKGLNQDSINARLAQFAARAQRLGLKLVSIDMSAMDSSWLPNDRLRVRKLFRAVVDTIKELLEAHLQDDYVVRCRSARKRMRWTLRYIEVHLEAIDAILFSGERGTAAGNRNLILLLNGAELIRVYGYEEGCRRIGNMFYCPPELWRTITDEKQDGPVELQDTQLVGFPESPEYDINIGDGDDSAMAIPDSMYASEKEMVLAYQDYYKLVEPCSAWGEDKDIECLSVMAINVDGVTYYIPKVVRNLQRILAHKLKIPSASLNAEGIYTYLPSAQDYAAIATDLWQRSFSLKHTMVVRHICRAMFEYCYSKLKTNATTIYDEDLHRLGKEDGDRSLRECFDDVLINTSQQVSAYAMIKATHFRDFHTLPPTQVKELRREWYAADDNWSTLRLTDDLCSRVDTLLDCFPIPYNVAADLGFKQEILDRLQRQLVKEKGVLPEMRVGTRPGGLEESKSDGTGKPLLNAVSIVIYKGDSVLCGYEPIGKPRAGVLTFPAGKVEPGESPKQAIVRELKEEAGLFVIDIEDLVVCKSFSDGKYYCTQFCLPASRTTEIHSAPHPDQLQHLAYRTCSEVLAHESHRLADCVREAIRAGSFIPTYLGHNNATCSKCVVVESTPPPDTQASANSVPGSSAPCVQPAFEVKACAAEAPVKGPSPSDKNEHSHQCPRCNTEFSHSHPYNNPYHHVRKGGCPNEKCSYYKKVRLNTVGALTSSEQKEIRQPSVSSPLNGYGTPSSGKGGMRGKATNTCSQRLSPSSAVKWNAGKSWTRVVESKGKSQTTTRVKTPVPPPPPPNCETGSPNASCSLQGTSYPPTHAGISGQGIPEPGDIARAPPCPEVQLQ